MPTARSTGQVVEVLAGQNSTSGGSSDSEVKEFIAIPTGPSGVGAVITATPVG